MSDIKNDSQLSNNSNIRNVPQGLKKLISQSSSSQAATPHMKKPMTPEEELEQQKTNFFKIIAATLKYQSPDDPADTSSITQTYAILEQTKASFQIKQGMEKLLEVFKSAELTRALDFQGKIINYDTGKAEFNGSDAVKFHYQIKTNPDTKPMNAYLISNISVVNGQGVEVYKSRGANKPGKHAFTWDGRNIQGKTAPEGTYRIKVDAYWESQVNGTIQRQQVEAGGYDTGEVELVHTEGDGKTFLKVNGITITMDEVIDVMGKAKKDEALKISDFSNYIGKTATLDSGKIDVKKGRATISFENHFDLPGNAKIKIFNEDGMLVAISHAKGVKKGLNDINFRIMDCYSDTEAEEVLSGNESDRKEIPNGKYDCEIYVEDLLSTEDNKFVKIENNRQLVITGLDFSNKNPHIISGSEKFKPSQIISLNETNSVGTSLYTKGLDYLGKMAEVKKNFVKYEGGDADPLVISLPEITDSNSRYSSIKFRIFDDRGELIREIDKKEDLIFQKSGKLFDDNQLYDLVDNSSRRTLFEEMNIPLTSEPPSTLSELETYLASLAQATGEQSAEEVTSEEGVAASEAEHTPIEDSAISSTGASDNASSESHIASIEEVKEFLKEKFYAREQIFTINGPVLKYQFGDFQRIYSQYDTLSPTEQDELKIAIYKNNSDNIFIWDGKDPNGKQVKTGLYKFEVLAIKETNAPEGKKTEKVEIPNRVNIGIKEYKIEDNKLVLVGNVFEYDDLQDRYKLLEDQGLVSVFEEDIVKMNLV